jgi:hypothetical protein
MLSPPSHACPIDSERSRRKIFFYYLYQVYRVAHESRGAKAQRLPPGKLSETHRELRARRHYRLIDKNRNHPDPTSQRGLDLNPHVVIRIIDTTLSARPGEFEPRWTNKRKEHVTRFNCHPDRIGEFVTRVDRIHVDEDFRLGEVPLQALVEPGGRPGILGAAV